MARKQSRDRGGSWLPSGPGPSTGLVWILAPAQLSCPAMRSPGSVRLTRLVGLIAVVVWIAVVWIPGTVARAQAPSPETPGIEAPADPETGAPAAQPIPEGGDFRRPSG